MSEGFKARNHSIKRALPKGLSALADKSGIVLTKSKKKFCLNNKFLFRLWHLH